MNRRNFLSNLAKAVPIAGTALLIEPTVNDVPLFHVPGKPELYVPNTDIVIASEVPTPLTDSSVSVQYELETLQYSINYPYDDTAYIDGSFTTFLRRDDLRELHDIAEAAQIVRQHRGSVGLRITAEFYIKEGREPYHAPRVTAEQRPYN